MSEEQQNQVSRSVLFAFFTNLTELACEQYKYVIDVDGNGWSGRFHR